jgi:hypothetical protein
MSVNNDLSGFFIHAAIKKGTSHCKNLVNMQSSYTMFNQTPLSTQPGWRSPYISKISNLESQAAKYKF